MEKHVMVDDVDLEEMEAPPAEEYPSNAKEEKQDQQHAEQTAGPKKRRCLYFLIAIGVLVCAVVVVCAMVLSSTNSCCDISDNAGLQVGGGSYRPPPPMSGFAPEDTSAPYPTGAGDEFDAFEENAIQSTLVSPVSTFSADVDTASYSYVRRLLRNSQSPPADAVRVEEFINYFDYDYPQPQDKRAPFQPTVMLSESPWNVGRKLMHIGIKGYDVDPAERPPSNIVFLVDVSGSMSSQDKLPLARKSIKMLLKTMDERDHVSIVTYASRTGIALQPTAVTDKGSATVLSALDSLAASGSTNGQGGIELAYELAETNFDSNAVNRIILVTDGDFNVGVSDVNSLKELIEEKRESGIFLSVLGFGIGNYHDTTMKALANHGNGVAAYIDSVEEAHKVMVTEAFSTVFPIAKDVKFQVEFNPERVLEYRLVGYEKRILNQEDFDNDKVDAGDIGSGHTVTAIYEIALVESEEVTSVALRTTNATESETSIFEDEYALLKIRYKLPDEEQSNLLQEPITDANQVDKFKEDALLSDVVREFAFSTAVAGFAQVLKGGSYIIGDYGLDEVLELAELNLGNDHFGYRRGFVELVQLAQALEVV